MTMDTRMGGSEEMTEREAAERLTAVFAADLFPEDNPAKKPVPQPTEEPREEQPEDPPVQPDTDPEPSNEPEEEEQPAATLTLKLPDGTEVPADEAVKGYLRQADYTRKTQEVAERRKALESEAAEVKAEREKYRVVLEKLEAQTYAVMGEEPDWDRLRAENPQEFAVKAAEWARAEKRLQVLAQEQQKIQQQAFLEQQKEFQQHMQQQQELLLAAVPEWKDDKVRQEEFRNLRDFALRQGFSEQELDSIRDHRAILLLRKAFTAEKAQHAAKDVKPTATPAAKVLKPGSAAPSEPSKAKKVQTAQSRHKREGSIASAVELLDALGIS